MGFNEDFATFTQSVMNFSQSLAQLANVKQQLTQQRIEAELSLEADNLARSLFSAPGTSKIDPRAAVSAFDAKAAEVAKKYSGVLTEAVAQETVNSMKQSFFNKMIGQFYANEVANFQNDYKDTFLLRFNTITPGNKQAAEETIQKMLSPENLASLSPEMVDWAKETGRAFKATYNLETLSNAGIDKDTIMKYAMGENVELVPGVKGALFDLDEYDRDTLRTKIIPGLQKRDTEAYKQKVDELNKAFKEKQISGKAYAQEVMATLEASKSSWANQDDLRISAYYAESNIISFDEKEFEYDIMSKLSPNRAANIGIDEISNAIDQAQEKLNEYKRLGFTQAADEMQDFIEYLQRLGSSAEGGGGSVVEETNMRSVLYAEMLSEENPWAAVSILDSIILSKDDAIPYKVREKAYEARERIKTKQSKDDFSTEKKFQSLLAIALPAKQRDTFAKIVADEEEYKDMIAAGKKPSDELWLSHAAYIDVMSGFNQLYKNEDFINAITLENGSIDINTATNMIVNAIGSKLDNIKALGPNVSARTDIVSGTGEPVVKDEIVPVNTRSDFAGAKDNWDIINNLIANDSALGEGTKMYRYNDQLIAVKNNRAYAIIENKDRKTKSQEPYVKKLIDLSGDDVKLYGKLVQSGIITNTIQSSNPIYGRGRVTQ